MSSLSRFPIKIVIEDLGEAKGELIRFLAPRTVETILRVLPIEGRACLWKEEVYFEIPVQLGSEKPTLKVEPGTIGYWPLGKALCIFYGKSQPYSRVNIVGKIKEGLDLFTRVKSGMRIKISRE